MHRQDDSPRPGAAPARWDETRFRRLFGERHPEVRLLLQRVTGSAAEADDLAQEVFLRCWRQAPPDLASEPEEETEGRLRAWLWRCALNLGMNAVRDRRRLAERHRRAGREAEISPAPPGPAQLRETRAEAERVRAVLGALPGRQARLLHLRHAGLSYRELAEVLEVAPGSIGTLLARAEEAFARAWTAGERVGEPVARAVERRSSGREDSR
jgi:RNA polymerase sigma-70 factor (ECF subfamily)